MLADAFIVAVESPGRAVPAAALRAAACPGCDRDRGAVGVVTASSKGKYYVQCKRLKIGNISPSVPLAVRAQKANEV